jgi:DNA-binding beta-propeller fold protein YncE
MSLLAGCGQSGNQSIAPVAHITGRQGSVHGGQQPVSGATIQLYAVGTTGDGSAATPLFTNPGKTDSSGGFAFGPYSCPTPNTLVYLVATGGNPGLPGSVNNSALILMAALGQCGNLSPSTFINVNEITTAASVFPLAPYMVSFDHIGSAAADAASLSAAFGMVNEIVNTTSGTTPGPAITSGYGVPADQINTVADILASCVNSAGGVSGDGSVCGQLFQYTGGGATTNTIAAALQIANNPSANTTQLFQLMVPQSPFLPMLDAAPSAFHVGVLPLAPAPVITPGFGTSFPLTVSITDSLIGSRVYYTTDGSTPTAASTLFTAAFSISAPTTIKAIAVASGYPNSPVASVSYGANPAYTVNMVNVCPVVDTICVPYTIAANPVTNIIYVMLSTEASNAPGTPQPSNLTIMDGGTDTVSNFITLPVGQAYFEAAANPVTNTIYSGNGGSGIIALNGYTNAFTPLLGQATQIANLVVNPLTNQIYVIDAKGTLYILDVASGGTTSIPVGVGASAMDLNQSTNHLYVGGNPNLLNIDLATDTVVDAFTATSPEPTTPPSPSVAVNPITNKVYVATSDVLVYDPITMSTTLLATDDFPEDNPLAIAVNPATNTIYSLNANFSHITVINGATNTVTATIAIPVTVTAQRSMQVVVDPGLNKLYALISLQQENNVWQTSIFVLDGSTNTLSTIATLPSIGTAVLNPATHKLYIPAASGNVIVITPP